MEVQPRHFELIVGAIGLKFDARDDAHALDSDTDTRTACERRSAFSSFSSHGRTASEQTL